MLRHIIAGTSLVALCFGTLSPAFAQHRHLSGFDGPGGASATINLRIPLDRRAERERPSVGLTLGYGRRTVLGDPAAPPTVHQLRMADLRFDREGLARAELATFDLAHLDQDRRLNLGEGKSYMIWLILAAFASLAVVLVVADGGSSSSEPEPEPETPPPTSGGG